MNPLPRFPMFLFALLALLSFSACEKETIDNSDQQHPIQLTLSKPDRNIVLEWTKTNLSNFDGYFLVRSTEPIPDAMQPGSTFAVVDDLDKNTFMDAGFPLSEKLYYKVFVKAGERFLSSPTVSIDFDVNLLDIQVETVAHSPDDQVLFLFDAGRRTIFRYDYALGEFTHQLQQQNNFTYVMAVGNAGQGTELFLSANNSNKVAIYDANDLSLKTSFFANDFVSSIEMRNGAIYVATAHFSAPLAIYDRSTLALIEGVDLAQSFERRMKFLPGNDNVLIDASFEHVIRYRFDDNNMLIEPGFVSQFGNPLNEIVTSPDGQHFIYAQEGMVMNRSLNTIGTPGSPSFNFFQDFVFSADGKRLYAFQFSPSQLFEFSFPELELIRTLPLNYFPMRTFRANDGRIVAVGLVSTGFTSKTYVDVFEP